MLTFVYWVLAWLIGCFGYALAHRQGRFALRWGWLSCLFLFPPGLLWRDRHILPVNPASSDREWRLRVASDAELRAAVERIAPLGESAVERLAVDYRRATDKSTLPVLVKAIEERWAGYREGGFTVVEARQGVDVLRDGGGVYHVGDQLTRDLRAARVLAHIASKKAATA